MLCCPLPVLCCAAPRPYLCRATLGCPTPPAPDLCCPPPHLPTHPALQVKAHVKTGAGYKLMSVIQPWQESLGMARALPSPDLLFKSFLLRQESDKIWKKLAKACFPVLAAAALEGSKEVVKAFKKELEADR